jgi:small subunit ribosomal protein S7
MPDPIYRSVVVTQFVNKVLQRGKRSTAERIVYEALHIIEEKTGSEPIATLKRAVDNVKPQLEVRSRRVGGATYQVPVEVRPRRANTLAIRWIVGYSRQRRERTMAAAAILLPWQDNQAPGSTSRRRLATNTYCAHADEHRSLTTTASSFAITHSARVIAASISPPGLSTKSVSPLTTGSEIILSTASR